MPKRITVAPTGTDTAEQAASTDAVGETTSSSMVDVVDREGAASPTAPAEANPEAVPEANPEANPEAKSSTSPSARARRLGGVATALPPADAGSGEGTLTLTKRVDGAESADPQADLATTTTVRRGQGVKAITKQRERAVEHAKAETPNQPARRKRRKLSLSRTGMVAAILLVIALVLAVANLLLWHPWEHPSATGTDATAKLRGQILSTANQSVANVITYSYKTWDADQARAAAGLSGQFKTDYTNAMSGSLKKDAADTQTSVVGKVNSSGLMAINKTGTEATVAVYAQTTKTNKSNTQPVEDLQSLRVILDKINGKWMITKLNYIS